MGKLFMELLLIDGEVDVAIGKLYRRRKGLAECAAGELAGQISCGLTFIRGESGYINQRLDVIAAVSRRGDDLPTIGMADKYASVETLRRGLAAATTR